MWAGNFIFLGLDPLTEELVYWQADSIRQCFRGDERRPLPVEVVDDSRAVLLRPGGNEVREMHYNFSSGHPEIFFSILEPTCRIHHGLKEVDNADHVAEEIYVRLSVLRAHSVSRPASCAATASSSRFEQRAARATAAITCAALSASGTRARTSEVMSPSGSST